MADDQNTIGVLINFEANVTEAMTAIDGLKRKINELAITSTKMGEITGRMLPGLDQQIVLLRALGEQGDKVAAALAGAAQTQKMFYTAFSGNVKQNLATLFKNRQAYQHFTKTLRDEFSHVAVVATDTGKILGTVADDAAMRWRLMASVMIEEQQRIANRMITLGKQAQWVGRQLIVGVTAPIMGVFYLVSRQFLDLNRQVTELTKFMMAGSSNVKALANDIKRYLVPQLQQLAIELGANQEEMVALAASWVAAGFDNRQLLYSITRLTAELAMLTQGDLELAEAQELVRSIMATFFDQTRRGVEATERSLQKLQLIQSITSLQMADMAKAIPLVSSVAKTLGILPEEIAAMLAGMRQMGVQATVAANALKFGLARLAEPTDEAAQAFQALTGTTLGEILFEGGRPRGIAAIEDLARIFEQLNQEQRIQLASLLFGNRQYDRFLKLIQAIRTPMSDYNKALEETEQQSAATNFWNQQLQVVLESVAKKWDRLVTRLKVFAANLGELVIPRLITMTDHLLSMLEAFERLPKAIQNTIITLSSLAAALGPVIYVGAFVTKLIPGNIRVAVPLLLRRIFGVTGVESPELLQKLQGLPGLIAAGMPQAVMTGGKLLPWESMAARRILLGLMMQRLPPGTALPSNIANAPLSFLAQAGIGGGKLSSDQVADLLRDVLGFKFLPTFGGGVSVRVPGTKGFMTMASAMATPQVQEFMKALDALGIVVQDEISENVVKGMTAGVAATTTKPPFKESMKRFGSTFMSYMKTFFMGTEQGVLLAGPRGDFTALTMRFTSILPKLIILLSIAVGVLANWRDIWKGLGPAIDDVGEILKNTFASIAQAINAAFGRDKAQTTKQIWVDFGETLGDILRALAETVDWLANNVIVPAMGMVVTVFKGAFDVFSSFIQIISSVRNGFSGLVAGIKTFLSSGMSLWAWVGRILGIMTMVSIATRIWKSRVGDLILALFNFVKVLIQTRSAVAAFQASLSGIGLGGWIGIVLTAITVIAFFTNWLNKTNDAIKEITQAMSSMTEKTTELIQALSEIPSGEGRLDAIRMELRGYTDQLIETIEKTVRGFTDLADNVSDVRIVNAAYQALIPSLQQINNLTLKQRELLKDVLKARLNNLYLERAMTQSTISAAKEQIALLEKEWGALAAQHKTQLGDPIFQLYKRRADILKEMIEDAEGRLLELELIIPIVERALGGLNTRFDSSAILNMQERLIALRMELEWGIPKAAKKSAEAMQQFKDALETQLGQAMDRFVEATLAEFDRQTDNMVAGVERQIEAIDKQIAKIEELNQKEEEVQREREYRRRREELLRQLEINAAIAAVERLIAIHQGQFDEARLISLRAKAEAEQTRNELRDLDRERRQEVEQDRRDKQIERLRRRQDALREQIDRIQEMRSKQRTLLQNMLEDVTEFGARNRREWREMQEDILGIVDKYGIDIRNIGQMHIELFGRSISAELADAFRDARIAVAREAESTGEQIGNSLADGMSKAAKLEVIDNLLNRIITFNKLARLEPPEVRTQMYEDLIKDLRKWLRKLSPKEFHTGGYVKGGGEVPAILEPGEYIINKRAVKRLGVETLDMLNNYDYGLPRFHAGGFVRSLARSMMYARASLLAGMSQLVAQDIGRVIARSVANTVLTPLARIAQQISPKAAGGVTIVKGRGPFRTFPLPAWANYSYIDSWGAPRPGGRTHQGTDIIAPMGTPVLATFPGRAVVATNTLGGLAAKVYGPRGYTYNAHFARFGKIGPVKTGDVIGYVGATGNAGGPHLHFEWHPGNGAAVNPYPYLRAVDPHVQKARVGGIVKFSTPAVLHPGEAIVPQHVTRALSRAGSQPPVVNIAVTIEGDLYGDDASYRKLYETLERVGRSVARQRGANNIMIRV